MSADIPAILALFPKPSKALPTTDNSEWFTVRGPYPYDYWESEMPGEHPPELVRAVEGICRDERWGPVFGGELSSYDGDQSQADLALCGELARRGLKPALIDQAFRASGLYREKWERDDYRQATIARALPKTSAEPDNGSPGMLDPEKGRIKISTTEPLPRDWIVDGLLLSGKSVVLAGFGGVSKTQLAIQLAKSVVLGQPFAGKSVKKGRAMLLLGEEDEAEISRRVSAVVRDEGLDQDDIRLLEDCMFGFPLVGQDMRLTIKLFSELHESPLVQEVIETARKIGDVRLIVLDHLALVHGGDFNAREDAALTMRLINHICQKTGAAVLLLAHTPKSAMDKEESDASMIAGSTAYVDQARGAWVLSAMRDNEAKTYAFDRDERLRHVSLAVVKSNYGPTGEVSWFERMPFDGVGLLKPVNLLPQLQGRKEKANLEDRIVEIVAAYPGRYSRTKFRDTQSGKKDGPLKASKSEVDRAIDILLEEGRLTNRVPSQEERMQHRLSGQVTHVLDVGSDA